MKNMQDFILTGEEVKVYVGFFLFAGYHKLPAEKLYWSEDEDVGIPIIKTATGTVKENRVGDCPLLSSNELKKTVRGNYDYQFDRNGAVLFVRWHDNRCVTIGTNFDKVEPLGAATRYSRQASKKTQVQQPAVLKSYNTYMGAVDHHDWLVAKYATVIRGKKWYWVLFTPMLEMALLHAWLFYRLVHGKDALDFLDFRRAVTVTYLKLDTGRPNIGRPMEYPSSQLRVIPEHV
ncbi:piggyBac transposable element-derived protein 3-like [Schistocerca nitens]|uniref:piggyBac transposable element-derived protein 3-like n=1 Tax=Schistocerca nitens TaxID=7011 RepID=UPI00211928A2|nr:piggyBac transposable element-derived protein 3-like [Schistocerca nitens]